MKKSITITIPEPCHEDWGKMSATEKGKFCEVCTKEVIDFTKTNDEDLVKKLSADGNLCGRFNKSQLNREVKLERKSRNSFMPYAASLLLPLSILSPLETKAQGGPKLVEKPMTSLGIGNFPSHTIEKSIVRVSGLITDSHGTPLNNVEILVLETGDSVFSAKDGTYQLKCMSGSTLVFQHAGRKEHQVKLGGHNSVVNVLLEKGLEIEVPIIIHEEMILGGIHAEPLPETVIECEEVIPLDIDGLVIEDISEEEEEEGFVTITGTVADEQGYPLPGANVIQKGTTNGTQTDFDGLYTLKVKTNSILVFSYISYENQEITVSNIDNTIDVAMESGAVLGLMAVGFIVVQEDSLDINPYQGSRPSYDHEREQRRAARKLAAKNEHEFKKIKKARKKAKRNK